MKRFFLFWLTLLFGFSSPAFSITIDYDPIVESDEIAQIDLLIVYSKSSESLFDGQFLNLLPNFVIQTNHFLSKSDVKIHVNLVDTMAVDYSDELLLETAIADLLLEESQALSEVPNRRFESGADMVAFLRPSFNSSVKGAASVAGKASGVGHRGQITSFKHQMYFVVQVEDSTVCGSCIVFAHEFGHTLGINHSRKQGVDGLTFPFALGMLYPDGYGTILAYADYFYPQYSNPNQLCNERPCGVNRFDPENGTDAAYALNAVRFEAQNMMHPNPDLSLASNLIEMAGNKMLAECLRNRQANKYPAIITKLDCQNSGLTDLAGIEYLTELEELNVSNNDIQDISPLSSLTKLNLIDLNHNNILSIDALSSLKFLKNIDLSHNKITSVAPLFSNPTGNLITLNVADNSIVDAYDLMLGRFFGIPSFGTNFDNNVIFCWQLETFKSVWFYFFENPLDCDPSQDQLDRNNNGINNLLEAQMGLDPIANQSTTIAFELDSYVVDEGAAEISINIIRSGDLTQSESVFIVSRPDVSIGLGDAFSIPAEPDIDFRWTQQNINFLTGQSEAKVTIELFDDDILWPDRVVPLQIISTRYNDISSNQFTVLRIKDDETPVHVDLSAWEEPTAPLPKKARKKSGAIDSAFYLLFLLIIFIPRHIWFCKKWKKDGRIMIFSVC